MCFFQVISVYFDIYKEQLKVTLTCWSKKEIN